MTDEPHTVPDEPDLTDQQTLLRRLDQMEDLLTAIKSVLNSQSTSINWLVENTSGLFAGFRDMMEKGGPAAIMPQLLRKG